MDHSLHNKLRARIREVIAERNGLRLSPEGGFLPLLPLAAAAAPVIAPLAGKALGWLGDKLFGSGDDMYGDGKHYSHKPEAKTRKPNAHAKKVKEIMAYYRSNGASISLGAASKLAKQELAEGPAPAPRKARKPRKPRTRKPKNDD